MPVHRHEFRIIGRLPQTARDAFTGMDVREVPAETLISGEVDDDRTVSDVLRLIQSLGLRLLSVRRVGAPHRG